MSAFKLLTGKGTGMRPLGRVIKSRRLVWEGHVARMDEVMSAFKLLTGKCTGKRSLGRTRRRWEDNIRVHIKK